MSTDKISEVRSFLLDVKTAIQRGTNNEPRWTFSTVRDKNMDTLAELEMDLEDAREVILSLTPMDYCSGPLKDSKIEGDLWVFGKEIKGREIYIKLKLAGSARSHFVKVLSFHSAGTKLNYYFKKKGKKEIKI